MDTEKFIQCVINHPILYNTQHKYYKDYARKNEVWEKLGKEMNESSEALRTKWKGLKDGYTKYKKWVTHRKASVKSYSNWRWGAHLEFLDPFINMRKRRDDYSSGYGRDRSFLHMEMSTEGSVRDNEGILQGDDVLDNECQIKIEPLPLTVASTPSTSRSQSRASLRDPIHTEDDDTSKLLSFMQNKRSKGIDAVDLLFMSYADTFKKFSLLTQTKLKVQMATIFAEAELQEHNSSQQ